MRQSVMRPSLNVCRRPLVTLCALTWLVSLEMGGRNYASHKQKTLHLRHIDRFSKLFRWNTHSKYTIKLEAASEPKTHCNCRREAEMHPRLLKI